MSSPSRVSFSFSSFLFFQKSWGSPHRHDPPKQNTDPLLYKLKYAACLFFLLVVVQFSVLLCVKQNLPIFCLLAIAINILVSVLGREYQHEMPMSDNMTLKFLHKFTLHLRHMYKNHNIIRSTEYIIISVNNTHYRLLMYNKTCLILAIRQQVSLCVI